MYRNSCHIYLISERDQWLQEKEIYQHSMSKRGRTDNVNESQLPTTLFIDSKNNYTFC